MSASGKIIGRISLRRNKYKNGQASVYWSERTASGAARQVPFYWGSIPTKRLEKLLNLLVSPGRNERKRICRIFGLKISQVPKEKLRDSLFVKEQLLSRLKASEQPQKMDLRQLRKIVSQIDELRERAAKWKRLVVKQANDLRELGLLVEGITGHKRIIERDRPRLRSILPPGSLKAGKELAFFRLALSTSKQFPQPIDNVAVAMHLWHLARECMVFVGTT